MIKVNPLDHGIDYDWHGWAFKFTNSNAIRIVMPTGRTIDAHAFPPSEAEAVLYAMAKTIMYHDAETEIVGSSDEPPQERKP